jgi:hypothetical protein
MFAAAASPDVAALARAVEALARSVRDSATTSAAWVQAGAAVVLVLVTLAYVRHTGRMAKDAAKASESARDSADQAKQLVELERQKLAEAHERETREAEDAKRILAGALAAELGAFLSLTSEAGDGPPATWAPEQSYCVIFDSAGPRLFLLGAELVRETTTAYAKLKRGLDGLRYAAGLSAWTETDGGGRGREHITAVKGDAWRTTRQAADLVAKVLPKLEAAAQ